MISAKQVKKNIWILSQNFPQWFSNPRGWRKAVGGTEWKKQIYLSCNLLSCHLWSPQRLLPKTFLKAFIKILKQFCTMFLCVFVKLSVLVNLGHLFVLWLWWPCVFVASVWIIKELSGKLLLSFVAFYFSMLGYFLEDDNQILGCTNAA